MSVLHIVTNATPKLAPELTPKVYAPANGLRNMVCIINPEIDNAVPERIATIAFGNLRFHNILYAIVSAERLSKRENAFSHIEPEHKSITNKNTVKMDKTQKNNALFFIIRYKGKLFFGNMQKNV